jgi:hypothetical protein
MENEILLILIFHYFIRTGREFFDDTLMGNFDSQRAHPYVA